MIQLQAKRFELYFLLKLSDLQSNVTLTLGYLYPALNNLGHMYKAMSAKFLAFGCKSKSVFNSIKSPDVQKKKGICHIIHKPVASKVSLANDSKTSETFKFRSVSSTLFRCREAIALFFLLLPKASVRRSF